jgi:hypothetical protein
MQDVAHLPLLLAILNRAAMDVTSGLMCSSKEKREAMCWIKNWEYDTYYEPYSYPWICEHLGIDPGRTRDIILSYTPTKTQAGRKRSFLTGGGYGMNRAAEALFGMSSDAEEYIVLSIRK